MFTVAMVAVIGMGMSQAYGTGIDYSLNGHITESVQIPDGHTEILPTAFVPCGLSSKNVECSGYTKVSNNNPIDEITVYYTVPSNVTCDVTSQAWLNDNKFMDNTSLKTNMAGSDSIKLTIGNNDTVKSKISFTNCF